MSDIWSEFEWIYRIIAVQGLSILVAGYIRSIEKDGFDRWAARVLRASYRDKPF